MNRLRLRIRCPEPNGDESPCPNGPEDTRHLQRFADFLNPSGSLVRAGAEVQVCGGPDEGVGLILSFAFRLVGAESLTLVG